MDASHPLSHWPGPHEWAVQLPEATDVPVMVPPNPGSHTHSCAAAEPAGLLELEGQTVHEVAVLVSALNWPPAQFVQPDPCPAGPRRTAATPDTAVPGKVKG